MQGAWKRRIRQSAGGMAFLLALAGMTRADDGQSPSLLGRLFRMGGPSSSTSGGSGPTPPASQPSRLPYGGSYYNSTPSSSTNLGSSSYGNTLPPGGASMGPGGTATPPAGGNPSPSQAPPMSAFGGLPETPPVTSSNGPTERLTPRSRVSTAVTTADPVLTRFALGRSNDGSTFGMFLQVFADGTVVDSEGVHHVRPADLKPILEAVQSGELYRLRGHCGAPSTDFIEYVHIVAYERRLGRLQAHSFSYSGNPQGCDHVVRHLHNAVESLQTKLSRPATAAAVPAASTGPAAIGAVAGPPPVPAGGSVIPLTPAIPGH